MPLDDGTELTDLLSPFYVRLWEIAWNDASDAGLVSGAFNVENPYFQDYLEDLGLLIRDIAKTTLEQTQEILGEAARSGGGVEEAARRMEERGLFSIERATTIANTESARGYSMGSIAAYRASGVVDRMEWLLGPEPCEQCQSLGGKIVALDEEFAPGVKHPPYHPRCTCAAAPVVREE